MKPLIASTGEEQTVSAGANLLRSGGNAVDAAVGAILAWPPSLMAAGVMVAVGSGLGKGAALFPVRVPGFGLSRSRRHHLLRGHTAAAKVATSCAAPAMATILARWGTVTILDAVNAASRAFETSGAPHQEALDLIGREGIAAFSRGAFAGEVARNLGPLEGGLLTRRDMIEARPTLSEAHGPYQNLWAPMSLVETRVTQAAEGRRDDEVERTLSLVVIDRRGVVVSAALETGPRTEPMPAPVVGVEPNTILAMQSAAQAKKVGQALAVHCGALAGGETEQLAFAGSLPKIVDLLGQDPGHERSYSDSFQMSAGLLAVRRSPGGQVDINGATSIERW